MIVLISESFNVQSCRSRKLDVLREKLFFTFALISLISSISFRFIILALYFCFFPSLFSLFWLRFNSLSGLAGYFYYSKGSAICRVIMASSIMIIFRYNLRLILLLIPWSSNVYLFCAKFGDRRFFIMSTMITPIIFYILVLPTIQLGYSAWQDNEQPKISLHLGKNHFLLFYEVKIILYNQSWRVYNFRSS